LAPVDTSLKRERDVREKRPKEYRTVFPARKRTLQKEEEIHFLARKKQYERKGRRFLEEEKGTLRKKRLPE